jgi:hypothetical protein
VRGAWTHRPQALQRYLCASPIARDQYDPRAHARQRFSRDQADPRRSAGDYDHFSRHVRHNLFQRLLSA